MLGFMLETPDYWEPPNRLLDVVSCFVLALRSVKLGSQLGVKKEWEFPEIRGTSRDPKWQGSYYKDTTRKPTKRTPNSLKQSSVFPEHHGSRPAVQASDSRAADSIIRCAAQGSSAKV